MCLAYNSFLVSMKTAFLASYLRFLPASSPARVCLGPRGDSIGGSVTLCPYKQAPRECLHFKCPVFSHPEYLTASAGWAGRARGRERGQRRETRMRSATCPQLGTLPMRRGICHVPRPPATRRRPWRPPPLATAAPHSPRSHTQAPIRTVQATPSVTPGASRPLLGGRLRRPPASRPLVPLPRACLSRAQLHPGHSVNTLHASCPATTPTATACGVWSTAVQADHPTRAQCRSASGPAARSAHQGPVAGGPRRR